MVIVMVDYCPYCEIRLELSKNENGDPIRVCKKCKKQYPILSQKEIDNGFGSLFG